MPTINVSLKDFSKLLGKNLLARDLPKLLEHVKAELDAVSGDEIKIDVKDINRPDLWSVEGLVREIKPKLGIQKSLTEYKILQSSLELIVDKSVKPIRPKIVGAIIKDIKINEELLKQLIQLQEKISLTFGRKRKEVAIGVYDFDKITWPLHYKAFKPNSLKFIPLGFEEKLSLSQILEKHPKGIEYGFLLKDAKEFPILIDSMERVCSMPPIINSNYTGKVTSYTNNLFVEVTGFNLDLINTALNVIVAALADRGASIHSLKVIYPNKEIISPDFSFKRIEFNKDLIYRYSGLLLTDSEIINLLNKKNLKAEIKENKVKVFYPAYRNDILHAVDIIEDLIISFGYNNFDPEIPRLATIGRLNKETKLIELIKSICIGLSLQEVMTFNLTSKEVNQDKMFLKDINFVELANPVSENYVVFKQSMIPCLLEFLANNKHNSLPQRIFEIGKGCFINDSLDNKVEEKLLLGVLLTDSEISFNEIHSVLQELITPFNLKFTLKEISHPSFISGRVAEILFPNGKKGIIGEIHPRVLERFSLEAPVVALELEF